MVKFYKSNNIVEDKIKIIKINNGLYGKILDKLENQKVLLKKG